MNLRRITMKVEDLIITIMGGGTELGTSFEPRKLQNQGCLFKSEDLGQLELDVVLTRRGQQSPLFLSPAKIEEPGPTLGHSPNEKQNSV